MALIPTVLLLTRWHSKVEFYRKRNEGERMNATVRRFVKEKAISQEDTSKVLAPFTSKMEDSHLISYAYVEIEDYDEKLVRLIYSNDVSPPYKVGDKINVFWYAGFLYYWDRYDRGLNKYIPSKWDFWNN